MIVLRTQARVSAAYIDRKDYILEVSGRTVRLILNARTLRDAQVKVGAQISKYW